MTDEEIKKALECCSVNHECFFCPLEDGFPDCISMLSKNALELINRQQEEIEELRNSNSDDYEPITHFFQD